MHDNFIIETNVETLVRKWICSWEKRSERFGFFLLWIDQFFKATITKKSNQNRMKSLVNEKYAKNRWYRILWQSESSLWGFPWKNYFYIMRKSFLRNKKKIKTTRKEIRTYHISQGFWLRCCAKRQNLPWFWWKNGVFIECEAVTFRIQSLDLAKC